MAQLNAALAAARGGAGRVVFIAGEPGVGKTRLAAETAASAEAAGMRALWGRCREEGGTPAHWPWVQILRALARDADPARLAAAAGDNVHILAAVVAEIGGRAPQESSGPVPSRFAFFDAVETFLRRLAAEQPLVLLVDDLHAADPSSLALLEFVVPELARARIVVIATYREHEASTNDSGRVIARAVRDGERIRLLGLGAAEVERLAAATAGHPVPANLVAAIHRATDGNPLFVQEMVRALEAQGSSRESATPPYLELADSVQHVIATRLEPLSAGARDVLAVAAVIGRNFDVTTLEAVLDIGAHELLALLQEPLDVRVVSFAGGVRGDATFTHALYREFFYSVLPASLRASFHTRVAAALERENEEANLSQIAFHLLGAGPVAGAARVVEYSRRAGDQALATLAYAQAVKHYEDALNALAAATSSKQDRCELLLRLGEAQFRASSGEASKATFRQAADAARAIGDAQRLARAALGLAGQWSVNGGIARADVVAAIEGALALLGDADAVLRAILLSRLAVEVYLTEGGGNVDAFTEEAVALGRAAGDARALAEALVARYVALGAKASLSERLAHCREALPLARKAGDEELEFRVRFQLVNLLLEVGDRTALDREIDAAVRLAARLRQPFYFWFVAAWRAAMATVDGRLDEAEALIEEAFTGGQQPQGREEFIQYAVPVYQVQLYTLRLDQGGSLEDIEPAFRALAESVPIAVMRFAIVRLHSAMERWADARDGFDRLAADDFAALPADWTLLPCLAFAADACAELGDVERAPALYARALPYAAHHVSNGSYYYGSMSYRLGRLAAAMGRDAEAADHFEAALKAHRRLGARCWLTRTEVHYAESLLRAGDRRHQQRALRMLSDASERARQIGMRGALAETERLLATARVEGLAANSGSPPSVGADTGHERAVFRKDGDLWTIEFAGVTRQMGDSRGLQYLQCLLRHPGREFHATELVQAVVGSAASATARASRVGIADRTSTNLGDAGSALDAKATAQYRRRLEDLRDELREAEAFDDLGRAARARQEMDFLSAELAAGARGRRSASHGERARLTVTKGIKAAFDRLRSHHPVLAQHLEATIKRGYFCSYTPDPRHPITWHAAYLLVLPGIAAAFEYLA